MFEIASIQIQRAPNQAVLPCQKFPNICIRIVDCTTHQPLANQPVQVGNSEANYVEMYLDAKQKRGGKSFVFEQKTYNVYHEGTTDAQGWICVPSLAISRDKKGDLFVGSGYAMQLKLPSYRPKNPDAPLTAGGPTTTFRVEPNAHTVIIATVISEEPILPAQFQQVVAQQLQAIQRIRISVEQGANLGNQSAALSLITNLLRLNFAGHIDVLATQQPLVYTDRTTSRFTFKYPAPTDFAPIVQAAMQRLTTHFATPSRLQDPPLVPTRNAVSRPNNNWRLELNHTNMARSYWQLTLADLLVAVPPNTTCTITTNAADVESPHEIVIDDQQNIYTCYLELELSLDSTSEPSIDAKLQTLDPTYTQNPAYGPNTHWIHADTFAQDATANPAIVGMLAGSDAGLGQLDALRTQRLKTHSILSLQPLLWHPSDRAVKVAQGQAAALCLPQAAAYFLEPFQVHNRQQFLNGLLPAASAGVVDSVLQRAGQNDIALMTVYGIHQAHDSTTATLLNNLARGALAAITKGNLSRKVVLFVVSKVDLSAMLAVANTQYVPLATAAQSLAQLANDHLLVIHAPPLPSSVFQLLVQASHFPVVLEGANTSNLVQMLGVPYISVSTRYTPYVAVPANAQNAHTELTQITTTLNKPDISALAADLDKVASYFHTAATTHDAFGGYFQALRQYVRVPCKDQLSLGLYRLAKQLNPDPVPQTPPDCQNH